MRSDLKPTLPPVPQERATANGGCVAGAGNSAGTAGEGAGSANAEAQRPAVAGTMTPLVGGLNQEDEK